MHLPLMVVFLVLLTIALFFGWDFRAPLDENNPESMVKGIKITKSVGWFLLVILLFAWAAFFRHVYFRAPGRFRTNGTPVGSRF